MLEEFRRSLALAIPLILAQLAQMSMSFVDTVMVGRLGAQQLASTALGSSVFFPLTLTCLGFLMATGPLVSHAFGAGRWEMVGRAVRQGLWLATLLAVPAFFILRNLLPLLILMGQDPTTAELTQDYLQAISWGVLPLLWFGVLRSLAEGISRPRVITLITIGAVALNVGANYVLMYGKLGFPALGLVGCGLASSLVYWAMFAALLWHLASAKAYQPYAAFSVLPQWDREISGELNRVGWPIAVSLGLEAAFFGATAFLMGLWGVTVLSAHQIAIQSAAFSYMVPLGVSMATAVRVGQAMGRGDGFGARRAGWAGIIMGAAFMTLAGSVFWLAPNEIASLFIDLRRSENRAVAELASVMLSYAALFQVFDGIQVNAMGALRGLKDTRRPMLIALLSYWVLGIGSGVLAAFYWNLGGPGLWSGMVLGLGTAAVLLTLRFRRLSAPLSRLRKADLPD